MRPSSLRVSAVGSSKWMALDYEESAFAVALFVMPSEDASGAVYTVQHTPDGPTTGNGRDLKFARTTTTLTITDTGDDGLGHGLSAGDDVIITGTGGSTTAAAGVLDGEYPVVTTPTTSTYTVTVANTGPTSGRANVVSFRVFNHAILVGVSGRQDGNYAFPPRHIRLKVTTLAAGFVELRVIQGMSK